MSPFHVRRDKAALFPVGNHDTSSGRASKNRQPPVLGWSFVNVWLQSGPNKFVGESWNAVAAAESDYFAAEHRQFKTVAADQIMSHRCHHVWRHRTRASVLSTVDGGRSPPAASATVTVSPKAASKRVKRSGSS